MSGLRAGDEATVAGTLLALYRHLGAARRRRLALVIAATIAGTIAELVTIGAVLPFLALLSSPDSAARLPGWGLFTAVVGAGTGAELAARATLLLVLAAAVAAATRILILRLTNDFVLMTAHDMSIGLFARSMRRSYREQIASNSAELLGMVEKLHVTTSGTLMPLIQLPVAVIMAAAITLLLIAIHPLAAGAAAGTLAAFYFMVGRVVRPRLAQASREFAGVATERMKTLQEASGSIREILLHDVQPVFEGAYRRLDLRFRRAQRVNMLAASVPRFLMEGLGIVLLGLLALHFTRLYGSLEPAIPLLGALALGAQRLIPLAQQIHIGLTSLRGNLASLREMLVGLAEPEPQPALSAVPAPAFESSIAFDQVSFRYDAKREPALRGISLSIPAGSRVAVIGRTGSGKSTLFDLLLGLLEPTQGTILIDGAPLDAAHMAGWQRQIAHVPQSIYLTDASVAANIAFAEDESAIDFARVEEAARTAQIDGLIRSLPDGYATPVGESGIKLSGGERQRIAIARALYRRPRLLVLDEATAALDETTEAALMSAIVASQPDLTILFATHRKSSLSWCDSVVILEQGRIVSEPDRHSAAAPPQDPCSE